MAVVCGDCQTDNRDGARFCKGCGRKLVQASSSARSGDWPETQRLPLPIPVAPPGIFDPVPAPRPAAARDDATAIMGGSARFLPPSPRAPLASPPHAGRAPAPVKSQAAPASGPSASGTPWRLLGVIAAIVILGGGWYMYGTRTADPGPADAPAAARPAAPAVEPPAAPVDPSFEAQLAAPSPAAVEAPAPPPPVPPPQAAAAKPRVVVVPKPRKPAPAPAVVPAPVAAVTPPPPVPAAPPPPAAPPNPQTACADLNFFARARCMVAQCAKPDFKASPQCDAVRRQQQIDEEKRNPTLAN